MSGIPPPRRKLIDSPSQAFDCGKALLQLRNYHRFSKEGLSSLSYHPSIMRIFDTGVFYAEHPFLVAEYLPRTLHQVIRADITPITLKISFATQLLSALAHLNSLNKPVIHRDIKPQNIFIKGNSCVLGDFGLMKWADSEAGEDKQVLKESLGVGMPARYRTPDQVAYLKGEAARVLGKGSSARRLLVHMLWKDGPYSEGHNA